MSIPPKDLPQLLADHVCWVMRQEERRLEILLTEAIGLQDYNMLDRLVIIDQPSRLVTEWGTGIAIRGVASDISDLVGA